jgi:hypothetical protein
VLGLKKAEDPTEQNGASDEKAPNHKKGTGFREIA